MGRTNNVIQQYAAIKVQKNEENEVKERMLTYLSLFMAAPVFIHETINANALFSPPGRKCK